jgi:hypothetical protein
MRQLNLKLTFLRARPSAKNLKDQRRAVNDLGLGLALEVPLLARAQFTIEDQEVDLMFGHKLSQIVNFAGTDERGRPPLAQGHNFAADEFNIDCQSKAFGLFQPRFGRAFQMGCVSAITHKGMYDIHPLLGFLILQVAKSFCRPAATRPLGRTVFSLVCQLTL